MENRIKNSYIYSFINNKKYLNDFIKIVTKCLIDNKATKTVCIDYHRLREELVFYKYYGKKNEDYIYDITYILPIILSNINLERSQDEVIKNISYYCKLYKENVKNYDYMIVGISYNFLIHTLILNKDIDFKELLQNIKEHVIGFTFDEDIDKKDIIKFERSRIKFIQKIDKCIDEKIEELKEESIVDGFFSVIYQVYVKDADENNQSLLSLKNSILGILGFEFKSLNILDLNFIQSLADYILRLRKYEINKKEYTQSTHPRELIDLNIGQSIYNPILNNITVIDKNIKDNMLYIKVKSKSGEYEFEFKKSQ
ncbi:hypothetical protein [Tepidibacter hydrothermalis]|uniref:Uncharacterized protein n=1 Tax=Tepidibacter hydrothermalis TaxID=3036126 RepID=A0ABY8E9A0_9FIRM|nr:hypothetical protein [Tepidibacter hydrothermalis]WFD09485.1 hypothetical protein P4S50_13965 [Tepidibacter hydrothermalis]